MQQSSISAHLFELLDIVDNLAAKDGGTVLQRRLVDDHCGTLCFYPLHNTLDGGLTEVVAIGFHGKSVYANYNAFLLCFLCSREGLTVAVSPSNFQHSIRDEILSGPVALYDGLDQVFRHILVICQELFGILGQAISAITEGRIVVSMVLP